MNTINSQCLNQRQALLDSFCAQEMLPESYKIIAQDYFFPLADEINRDQEESNDNKPLIIGINGSQGSGKSTLALLLSQIFSTLFNKNVANLSIDDFYKTKSERQQSATNIHPLLLTRGVPGTHDTALLDNILNKLSRGEAQVVIPRFDKSTDDRCEQSEWETTHKPVDIILLEGWCIGVQPQTQQQLSEAINELEQQEDAQGEWRNHINQAITQDYLPIFDQINTLIMLKAPSFDCVYSWRQKQEDKLRAKTTLEKTHSNNTTGIMTKTELERFIQHYQRLTEHMLATLPKYADIVFTLNKDHSVSARLDKDLS